MKIWLFVPVSCSLGIQAVEVTFASDKNPDEFGSGTSTNPTGRGQIVPHMLFFFFPELRARPKFPGLTATLCSQIPENNVSHHCCSCSTCQGQAECPHTADIWLCAAPTENSELLNIFHSPDYGVARTKSTSKTPISIFHRGWLSWLDVFHGNISGVEVSCREMQDFCSGAQHPAPPPGQFQIPERGSFAAPTEVAGMGLGGEEDPK